MSLANEAIANRAIQQVVRSQRFRIADLKKILAGLPDRSDLERLAATMKTEFNYELLQGMASPAFFKVDPKGSDQFSQLLATHPHPFDGPESIREASSIMVIALANTRRPWKEQVDIEPKLNALVRNWPKSMVDGSEDSEKPLAPAEFEIARKRLSKETNPLGKFWIARGLSVYPTPPKVEFRSLANLRATRILLATSIFHRQHGREASRLEELVTAKVLSSVPIDPFSGQPFRYDLARRRIWSVGPDGKDNGGMDIPGRITDKTRDYVWALDGHVGRP